MTVDLRQGTVPQHVLEALGDGENRPLRSLSSTRARVVVSSTEASFRFIGYRGQMVTSRVKTENGRLYEWKD